MTPAEVAAFASMLPPDAEVDLVVRRTGTLPLSATATPAGPAGEPVYYKVGDISRIEGCSESTARVRIASIPGARKWPNEHGEWEVAADRYHAHRRGQLQPEGDPSAEEKSAPAPAVDVAPPPAPRSPSRGRGGRRQGPALGSWRDVAGQGRA